MHAVTYHIAPPSWTHEDPNPFTADGSYGPGWSCFRIREETDSRGWNGRGTNGLFAYVVGRGWKRNLAADLADFIRYESIYGRQCIISVPADMGCTFVERALAETPDWSVVRPDDPKWLVHSTTVQGWAAIQACGELRAQARLRREGVVMPNLGGDWLGEPADYADYIILATAGAMAPEFVVASRNANRLHTEPDTPYTPGARLFFDGHQMIRDGLIVRDGLHGAKVYDHLPLDPYLVAAVTSHDLDPEGEVTAWTPKSFCLAALEYFSSVVGEPVPYEHWA
jgi:hypothetical protein